MTSQCNGGRSNILRTSAVAAPPAGNRQHRNGFRGRAFRFDPGPRLSPGFDRGVPVVRRSGAAPLGVATSAWSCSSHMKTVGYTSCGYSSPEGLETQRPALSSPRLVQSKHRSIYKKYDRRMLFGYAQSVEIRPGRFHPADYPPLALAFKSGGRGRVGVLSSYCS